MIIKLKFIKLNRPLQCHYIMKKSVLLPQLTEITLKNLEIRFWSDLRLGETSKCHIKILVFGWHYLLMAIKEIIDMTIEINGGKIRLQKQNFFYTSPYNWKRKDRSNSNCLLKLIQRFALTHLLLPKLNSKVNTLDMEKLP